MLIAVVVIVVIVVPTAGRKQVAPVPQGQPETAQGSNVRFYALATTRNRDRNGHVRQPLTSVRPLEGCSCRDAGLMVVAIATTIAVMTTITTTSITMATTPGLEGCALVKRQPAGRAPGRAPNPPSALRRLCVHPRRRQSLGAGQGHAL